MLPATELAAWDPPQDLSLSLPRETREARTFFRLHSPPKETLCVPECGAHGNTFAWVGGISAAPTTRAPEALRPDPASVYRLMYASGGDMSWGDSFAVRTNSSMQGGQQNWYSCPLMIQVQAEFAFVKVTGQSKLPTGGFIT